MAHPHPRFCPSANDGDEAGFLANTPQNRKEAQEFFKARKPIPAIIKEILLKEGIVDKDYPTTPNSLAEMNQPQ